MLPLVFAARSRLPKPLEVLDSQLLGQLQVLLLSVVSLLWIGLSAYCFVTLGT